ncbi:MAG: rod shape-determining protein [Ruminococcaceae bacterium]|nr:rod shape-determining protein [Oscillospiraceae bacterium]
MGVADIGIDLGTTSVLIYTKEKGIILREPSVVAVSTKTGEVIAVGEDALAMVGKTPDRIRAVRPLADGVVSDFHLCEYMLKYFIRKACGGQTLKPRVAICIPSEITQVERRSVIDAAIAAGARKVFLVDEPMAAVLGLGLDISRPCGQIVLDIGGGTTDIAVFTLNGIAIARSVRRAGNAFDQEIIRYVRSSTGLLIGERMAEEAKKALSSVVSPDPEGRITLKGRDLRTGLPAKREITHEALASWLSEPLEEILNLLQQTLEETPPELACDIYQNGIWLAGGGTLLGGLPEAVTRRTGLPTHRPEDPVACVARGAGLVFDQAEALEDGVLTPSMYRY